MKEDSEQVYDVLVMECGAADTQSMRWQFQAFWDRRYSACEFRFIGGLGFGGKVWISHFDPPRVSCYPEDETPERRAMIDAANAKLRELQPATAQAVAPESDALAPPKAEA